jgi:hypothetical protein
VGCVYDITQNLNLGEDMNDIYQSLEKMVRDVEKGTQQVDSFVKLNGIEYDATCYRIYSSVPEGNRDIRINLHRREVPVAAQRQAEAALA